MNSDAEIASSDREREREKLIISFIVSNLPYARRKFWNFSLHCADRGSLGFRLFSPFARDQCRIDAVQWLAVAYVYVQIILFACWQILVSQSLRLQQIAAICYRPFERSPLFVQFLRMINTTKSICFIIAVVIVFVQIKSVSLSLSLSLHIYFYTFAARIHHWISDSVVFVFFFLRFVFCFCFLFFCSTNASRCDNCVVISCLFCLLLFVMR